MGTKSKFQVYLSNGKQKTLYGIMLSEENGILKIREENGSLHRFKNYNNIVEYKLGDEFLK